MKGCSTVMMCFVDAIAFFLVVFAAHENVNRQHHGWQLCMCPIMAH
jgi:hypothetical protein